MATSRRYARLYLEYLIDVEGKTESDAKREAYTEVGRLLAGLNRGVADSTSKGDEVARRLWLEQWRDSLDMGTAPLPGIPVHPAADKSASTRRTRRAMMLMREDAQAGIAHMERLRAVHEIGLSRELGGRFTPQERDVLLAWLRCGFLEVRNHNRAKVLKLDKIVGCYRAWYGWKLSRSKIRTLLDRENPKSLFARIGRRWDELLRNGGVPLELSDAVCELLEHDEPELTDVQEVNPRTFRATGDDDGDDFRLAVWARPWFCWQQSITARNIVDAYGGFECPPGPPTRTRIDKGQIVEEFVSLRPPKFPGAPRQKERIEEFGRNPALLDRLRKPQRLALSYSQSGRGFVGSIREQGDAYTAMRRQSEHRRERDRVTHGTCYRNERPCDRDEAKEDVDSEYADD